MAATDSLDVVTADVVACRACPRLVAWREAVALQKRASFRDDDYWGKPVPGFGDPRAKVLIVGLAPAAHGGNRTGRVFTGDRSGDWVFRALWEAGMASQPTSTHAGDGLRLHGAYITAAVRCAPPANRPLPSERDACAPFLVREAALLTEVVVTVALGQFAHDAVCRLYALRPRPTFGHGAEHPLPTSAFGPRGAGGWLIDSFHPSQQNTFTGKLTEPAFDAVFARARELSGSGQSAARSSLTP